MGKKNKNSKSNNARPPRTSHDTNAEVLPPREATIVAAIAKDLDKASRLADEVDRLTSAMAAVDADPGEQQTADPWADVDDDDGDTRHNEDESELEALKRIANENRKKRRESSGYREQIAEEIKNEKETPAVAQMKASLCAPEPPLLCHCIYCGE